MSFWSEYGSEIVLKFWEHFYLSFLAIFLGILVAVPLGAWLTRVKKGLRQSSKWSVCFKRFLRWRCFPS